MNLFKTKTVDKAVSILNKVKADLSNVIEYNSKIANEAEDDIQELLTKKTVSQGEVDKALKTIKKLEEFLNV